MSAAGILRLPYHAILAMAGQYERGCTCRFCRPGSNTESKP